MSRWALRSTPPEVEQRWLADGWWDERTLGDLITGHIADRPDAVVVAHSTARPSQGTYADTLSEAQRLAAGLKARGLGPGDAIATQLPNWREAITAVWAANLLGAVVVPIVHTYGRREVDHILDRTDIKAFITTPRFGRLELLADHADRPALQAVEHLILVEDGDAPAHAVPYSDVLAAEPLLTRADVDPREPALVAYTSGTTSEPKGVVHTHRTLGAEVRQIAGIVPTTPRLMSSPVGHMGGLLTSLFVPLLQGAPIHLLDVWDVERVMRLMVDEDLNAGGGATFFLMSLLDAPGLTERHLDKMRHVSLGGAAVPEAVARRADSMGLSLTRNYGSSEHPTITGSRHGDPVEQRLATDGRPLGGVEIRIVDDAGQDLPAGEPGEILSRGPDCFVGYTDPVLTDRMIDADGWYSTEDIGVLDADGFLTITDRKKDIIIRGGENISAAEVEEVLARLPEVAEVAVIAAPDARFGEHACAVIRLRSNDKLTLQAVRDAAAAAGLGRQKWPEQLVLVDDFPRTPTGKIKKNELRARAAQAPPR